MGLLQFFVVVFQVVSLLQNLFVVCQVVGLLQSLFVVFQVAGRLQDFRELVKEVVRSACRTALLEAGFTPDDYFYDGADSPGMYGKVDSV